MAQPSVYFSAGRLTMLQRNVLDAAGMERLLSTASLTEARKTLSELGWTGADITDPEQLAADRVNQAAQDARALSPDPALVDCFLYAYDAANLKSCSKRVCWGCLRPRCRTAARFRRIRSATPSLTIVTARCLPLSGMR